MPQKHILTVDVEDNFTFDELCYKQDWDKYKDQVVENTLKIITILLSFKASATFFIVGKVAERHPELIEIIAGHGFEIASHSYSHIPLQDLDENSLILEISKGAEVLKQISGTQVNGFRAMGYSIPEDRANFYKILCENGYTYDSSCKYPAKRAMPVSANSGLSVIYNSYFCMFNKRFSFSGGTYLRFLPLPIIEYGIKGYENRGQSTMIYIHPWEFNKDQPARKVSLRQKLLQSPLTFNTERKLRYLLQKYRFVSIQEYLGS